MPGDGPVPAGRSVPPGPQDPGAYLNAPPGQARLARSREAPRAGRPGQPVDEPPDSGWSTPPPRGRRHRPEPGPEAAPEPVTRDRPAERTGPSRHGRAARDPRDGESPAGRDSRAGWDNPQLTGGHLGPGEASAARPGAGTRPGTRPGTRAASGQTATGWVNSGPIPSGRTSPGFAGAGHGAAAGFVADPEFDLDDRHGADREPTGWTGGRPVPAPPGPRPPADPRAGGEAAAGRRSRSRAVLRETPPDLAAGEDEAAAGAGRSRRPDRASRAEETERAGRRSGGRRSRRKLMIGAGLAVIVAGAAVVLGTGVLGSSGPAHVLGTPDKLGAYVRRPQLEKQMNAAQLQRQVITKSAGQATHVVSAVYEDGTSATSTQPPQMILFIGGNLTGVSPAGFIASFTQQSKGAFVTSAGSLGGSAACVNAQASVPGSVALCTWADNDTFGVVASPTMSATRLATQLRAFRPMVERVAR